MKMQHSESTSGGRIPESVCILIIRQEQLYEELDNVKYSLHTRQQKHRDNWVLDKRRVKPNTLTSLLIQTELRTPLVFAQKFLQGHTNMFDYYERL
jgi:hypothetical protein